MKIHSNTGQTARFCIVLLGVCTSFAHAESLKDPSTRDENISSTQIGVEYRQDGAGLWIYEYTLHAPEANTGRIGSFSIDLRCDMEFDNEEIIPAPPTADIGFAGRNNLDPVTPTAIRGDWGAAARFGIGRQNTAFWVMNIQPGNTVGKFSLISVAEPGLRQYELLPHMSTFGYDYPEGSDSDLPWIEDFTVQGVIAAPGCPGEVPPVERPIFSGTLRTSETESLNALLSYREPLQDRMQLPGDTELAHIAIVYGEDLDPKTFKVEPGWAKRHFHPEPGTEETVAIPLKKDRLRLFLEVHPRKDNNLASQKDEAPPRHAQKDRDEFEFRIEGGHQRRGESDEP